MNTTVHRINRKELREAKIEFTCEVFRLFYCVSNSWLAAAIEIELVDGVRVKESSNIYAINLQMQDLTFLSLANIQFSKVNLGSIGDLEIDGFKREILRYITELGYNE